MRSIIEVQKKNKDPRTRQKLSTHKSKLEGFFGMETIRELLFFAGNLRLDPKRIKFAEDFCAKIESITH